MKNAQPTSWRMTTIGNVADVIPGYAFKSKDWCDVGIPVIKIKNIAGDLTVNTEGADCVPSEIMTERLNKFVLRDGDMLIAMTGATAGKTGRLRCSGIMLVNQRVAKLQPRTIDHDFFWAIISSEDYQSRFFYLADGAAQPNMSGGQIERVEIPEPPLPTQRKIGSILSAYDDLIENNTRRIAILEEMALAIYREWFVNFRFPGHENVKLVQSTLGMIPQGWNVVSTRNVIHINPRTTVPKDGEKPFVSMGAIPHNTMVIDETQIEMRSGNSGAKFKNDDTLFARITPCLQNGKTAFVQFLPNEQDVAFGSTEFIIFRSKDVNPQFVYLLARSDEFRDIAITSMSGATGRQRVREECFDKFYFALPTPELLAQFQEIALPLFRNVSKLARKNINLRTTRDLLLPKLISGQLDVEDLDIDMGLTAEELQETKS